MFFGGFFLLFMRLNHDCILNSTIENILTFEEASNKKLYLSLFDKGSDFCGLFFVSEKNVFRGLLRFNDAIFVGNIE